MAETWAVVLAAGEGKRMRSARPKVLHPLAGRPLVAYSVDLASATGAAGTVVVVGHQGAAVRTALSARDGLVFAEQPSPRGTGHALAVARGAVPPSAEEVLLLYADVPLLAPTTIERLLDRHRRTRAAATLLTFRPPDPTGYGRIVRRAARGRRPGRVVAIVEERDATSAQQRIREANSGIYCFDPRWLWPALESLAPDNDQGEYYLTDVMGRLVRDGRRVETVAVADPQEVTGVNDRRQLAQLDALVRERILARLMLEGVTVLDPATTYVDADVTIGRDTTLYPGVRLSGRTRVGEGCSIETGCQLTDMEVEDGVVVRPYCVLDRSRIETEAVVGPFARLRPGSVVGPRAEVGNFIELKKATLGGGVKAHHFGYLGDTTVGEQANIGAGTVTCNYDGLRKHETRIGARAFVGTNASLVAPLALGDDSYVAAGSVVTRDVPAGALAVERTEQVTKEGWTQRRRLDAGGG